LPPHYSSLTSALHPFRIANLILIKSVHTPTIMAVDTVTGNNIALTRTIAPAAAQLTESSRIILTKTAEPE